MVTENCLEEDFPDPEEGVEPPATKLLECLGLKKRRGLFRIQIEQALFEPESEILKTRLRLDMDKFRLVCMPPDIHFRLGQKFGWGKQAF